MKRIIRSNVFATLSIVAVVLLAAGAACADDSKDLFNGKDFTGWQNAAGDAPAAGWVVEEGAMVCKNRGGYIWTKERFGDFILELEFKTQGNSGVFFRTDKPGDPVQTGIEIQVNNPSPPGKHSVGCFYDLVAPSKDVAKKDDWNKMVITAKDNLLSVELNGEKITEMDLDQWTEPGKNPDGSKNKFRTALKDFKRDGHVGFQDHGSRVAYRNVRIQAVD
jgi:hypothetical protein